MVYFLARMIAFLFILQMLTLKACGEQNKEVIYDSTSMNKWESPPQLEWSYLRNFNYWLFCPPCVKKTGTCKNDHNVLWTNYIDGAGADLLHLKIRFTIKNCTCQNASLSILSHQSDGSISPKKNNTLSKDEYDLEEVSANLSNVIQEKSKDIVIRGKGVHIGFKSNGGCIAILDVKIYPVYCRTYKKTNSSITVCQDYGNVPDPPKNVSRQCFDDHVIINWEAGNDNGSPILNYIVQYNSRVHFFGFGEPSRIVLPPSTFSTSVEVTCWRNYCFQVIAKNKIGESNPSTEVFCRTGADVPYKNPENVQARYIEPKILSVTWTPMSEWDHNGPDFHYMIYWKKNMDEKWNHEVVLDWQTKEFQFEVPELRLFDRYNVKVIAANHLGLCKAIAKEIIVRKLHGEVKIRMVWSPALPIFLIIVNLSAVVSYIWKKRVCCRS